MHSSVCSALLLPLFATLAAAQSQLYEFDCGACASGELADAAAVGDVDGDGVGDVAVSYWDSQPRRGLVRVHSGADGAIVREWSLPGLYQYAALAAGGDVDGDGRADVVVGTPYELTATGPGGIIRVFSGATSLELLRLEGSANERLGERVAGGLDVDGDGHDDVIAIAKRCQIKATTQCTSDAIRAFSGADGSLLYQVNLGGRTGLGPGLDALGDIDGDGGDDFLISDRQLASPGPGVVHLVSGRDGTLIRTIVNPFGDDHFGLDVAGLPDVTGDGVFEVGVVSFEAWRGRVSVFSGADGSLVWTVSPLMQDFDAVVISSVPDATGDGFPDVVVGALFGDGPSGIVAAGRVFLLSGVDGAIENGLSGAFPNEQLGIAVDGLEDLNGDGLGELVVATRWRSHRPGPVPGVVRVLSGGALRALERSCIAAPNSVGPGAGLSARGTQSVLDNDLTLAADSLPPGSFALLVRGARPNAFPFGDGYLCVDPFAPGLTRVLPVLRAGASGHVEWSLDLTAPTGPSAGQSWTFQALYRDVTGGPAGFNGTDALTATFVP